MAAPTFQAPINIDPAQDPAQQIAFINQNFQSLASTLETNSFRIILEGTTTITVPAASVSGDLEGPLIPHSLNITPTVIANVTTNTLLGSNGNTPTPWTAFSSTGTLEFIADFNSIDDTNIQFYVQWTGNNSEWVGVWTFKYFILQLLFD